MSKSHKIGRNSSFVSIWKAPAGKVSPDANEHKKAPTPIIGIEALRTIHRIVLAIQERIAASERTKPENGDQPCPVGDPRGSRTINSNSGTDNNRGEEERQ
jgi:hypothetical protein